MGFFELRAIRQILFFLVLAWTGGRCAAPVRAKTLAVLEFAGPGIPRVDVAEVSAGLGRSLAATGRFRLVELDSSTGRWVLEPASSTNWWGRSLDAMGRRRLADRENRRVCTSVECALKAGALRKVDRVVIGELQRRGSEWILTTRMMDVSSSSPLLKIEFRTRNGLLDLMDRGVAVVASRYDSAEIRLESVLAKTPPNEVRNPRDTALEARLEGDLRKWRPVVVISGALGLGALYGAGELWNRHVLACAAPREGGCKDPNRNLEYGLLGASAALGAVATASAVVVIRDVKRLRALKSKSFLDVSWTPLWDPRSEAVGLATRLDF